jgi:hypothetical protein
MPTIRTRRHEPTHRTLDENWAWAGHWTDLLTQGDVWRDRDGNVLLLNDMDTAYCSRLHAWIMRQSEAVVTQVGMSFLQFGDFLSPGGQAEIDLGNVLGEFPGDMGDAEWVRSQPLLRALERRAIGEILPWPRSCVCGYATEDDGMDLVGHCTACGYPDTDDWDHGACYPGIIVD